MNPHRPPEPAPDEILGALAALAVEADVPAGAAELSALARYVALLQTWNARINLTAARTGPDIISMHFHDVFWLARALGGPASVVDVGTGGGLPGLPLAILRPSLRVCLVESIAKKAAFLRTAIRELDLGARVSVEARRAEALAAAAPASFDVAVSRAAMPPPSWLALGARLVRAGGRVFLFALAGEAPAHPELRLRSRQAYAGGRRWLFELERST